VEQKVDTKKIGGPKVSSGKKASKKGDSKGKSGLWRLVEERTILGMALKRGRRESSYFRKGGEFRGGFKRKKKKESWEEGGVEKGETQTEMKEK